MQTYGQYVPDKNAEYITELRKKSGSFSGQKIVKNGLMVNAKVSSNTIKHYAIQ